MAEYENGGAITSVTHDGTEVAFYKDPEKYIFSPIFAPGGLLFGVLSDDGNLELDEIIALDAQTLQPRYQFGSSLLNTPCGLTVVGEELFVCDKLNDRLQVFSLAGEHRRSITGEWRGPAALCLVKDRLYLIEAADDETDGEGELLYPLCGRRIFALSSQGETLQVYTNPDEGHTFNETLCCFDGKLLAPVTRDESVFVGVVAMAGA